MAILASEPVIQVTPAYGAGGSLMGVNIGVGEERQWFFVPVKPHISIVNEIEEPRIEAF